MNALGEGGFVHYYLPSLNVTHNDCGVVVDSHVHADSIVAGKLDDRVIGRNSEDEHRLTVLDLNDG